MSEYSDMTKRVFKLSGIISFDQGLVNLVQSWPLEKVFEEDISLNGIGDVQKYEKDINSLFYKDITFTDILDIPDQRIDKIIRRLQEEFKISDPTALVKTLEEDKERQFLSLIDKEFSKERIIKLLYLFQERNDDEIKNIVTDSATIPTIFEYIIAIAWYYISDQSYSLLNSLNLTLDGDFKPLSHAIGGEGDIIVDYPDITTMLEATLMNKNSQKRGELEPVIRHAANLSTRKLGKVFTIFIADELDNNVVNIFRSVSQIELESTQNTRTTNSVFIFSLSISEVIELLINNITSGKIFEILNQEYNTTYHQISIGWRERVIEKLFN
ncbi:AlwI family type II restriction endonuclease [Dolosigranulum pigrum]|uniref:AlwI family type II restriction endonuclease n=1 Tax=Dolosigranulum pigrum TaxID=29394 RepID=UPI00244DED59|nr:AlwI family type II restriction endonuclease [Dolosigranulum pigrum]